jgi:hypothetical protein
MDADPKGRIRPKPPEFICAMSTQARTSVSYVAMESGDLSLLISKVVTATTAAYLRTESRIFSKPAYRNQFRGPRREGWVRGYMTSTTKRVRTENLSQKSIGR